MDFDFDAVVVGSGFGGAVAACRLAQAGKRVLVLERGRSWTPATYPRNGAAADWLWDQNDPQRRNGWADIRNFGDMAVVAGAGVGGGSLIYANVSVEAKPQVFEYGWPAGISHALLQPHYAEVGRMLEVQPLPANQINERTRLMQEGARKMGWESRLRMVPLAVTFADEFDPAHPENRMPPSRVNRHGVVQGTCTQCGNCVIGCQESAKNTLDLNYLAVARTHGAAIRPLHLVRRVERLGTGWRVGFERIGTGPGGSVSARCVVLAAGSIGTTELLLHCRDTHKTLPGLSRRLGHGWGFNGDFVSLAFHNNRKVEPWRGVTISAAIDLLDEAGPNGQRLFVEDGGFPHLAQAYVQRQRRNSSEGKLGLFWKAVDAQLGKGDPLDGVMPWFGQAVDPADGRLLLKRPWWMPWQPPRLDLEWDYHGSERVVESMISAHRNLAEKTGRSAFLVPPSWTALRNLVTPHPLGGCNMGNSERDGVVDGDGQVFGYPGLYVMDGAAVPVALGLNPSRTIAALAERNVAGLLARWDRSVPA